MFIQVEETPNPNSLKFYPGEVVLESGTANFQDKAQGSLKSPLAKALFKIRGVKSVFFAQDFITVSKEDEDKVEWNVLKPQIFSAIMIFYTMKQPILYSSIDTDPNEINENDSEIVKEIKALITDKIRPTIQEDGGDLEFVSYEDNIVRVRLQGACTSCPSSVVTLKNGIKNMLQFYIPDVQDVEQVLEED
jgi:Fe-S cluster biogenesis protein NfuA